LLTEEDERPISEHATIYILKGNISDSDVAKIKKYLINSINQRECSLEKPEKLEVGTETAEDVKSVQGFIEADFTDPSVVEQYSNEYGLGMDAQDLQFCQKYFRDEEKRDPTVTEMKMIDTYWSDHCRHTTFLTKLEKVDISWDLLQDIYADYIKSREFVYDNKKAKDVSLMDIATIIVKELKKRGALKDLDESEEVNACSIKAEILVDGKPEEYLVMFKNETHNHPTEIEPFGGANTCLGGAIRDPLSGRSYVYQAMRITGSGDPTTPIEDTMPNKLPQKTITTTAAKGYSSYGAQIGLASGQIAEIYHPNYVAKRMELGALIAAAPKENVVRGVPSPGDKIILLGARTGRDGCGAATGSSKVQSVEALTECSADVQVGNAPEERKIVRLFRNSEATKLIKRCNDFGAGGVSVAIGELADGLEINLDKVPTKYPGLDGTEIAISESQERMAIVIEAEDVERFQKLAEEENLESSVVATVTEVARVRMHWRGKTIVDISREFLDTNGTMKTAAVKVAEPTGVKEYFESRISGGQAEEFKKRLSSLKCCSQRGLVERFDSTVGAGTVFMPLGGKHQLTPIEAMCAKIPTLKGHTDSGTIMSYGYDPYLSEISPFHGAVFSNIDAVSKYVACRWRLQQSMVYTARIF